MQCSSWFLGFIVFFIGYRYYAGYIDDSRS